jgi:hypothetical protein
MINACGRSGLEVAAYEIPLWLAVIAGASFVLLRRADYRFSLRGVLAFVALVAILFAAYSDCFRDVPASDGPFPLHHLWWNIEMPLTVLVYFVVSALVLQLLCFLFSQIKEPTP